MTGGELVFGPFCLSLARRELLKDGIPVPLGSRAFDLLTALVQRQGSVVGKDELLAEVWPDTVVEENNLQVQISALRKALGEGPEGSRHLLTVPGRGYRFVGAVGRAARPASSSPLPEPSPPVAALPLPEKPSIAVLPFANMSGDPEQEYFADGMAEEILTALSRCTWLFVIARNSSFTYKGRAVDVRTVGQELGVRYVLEGSVRRGGDRLRFTGQLIDAITGAHIWADRFDGDLSDVFELQDRITENVVAAIEPKLQLAEIERLKHKTVANLNAYDHLLRAQQLEYEFTEQSLDKALGHLRQALEIDPTYAPAMALAAYCYGEIRFQGWTKDVEGETAQGLQYMSRALELAHFDPNVLWMCALASWQLGFDTKRAQELAYRSLETNPNSAIAMTIAGWIEAYSGNYSKGRELLARSQRLNPRDPRAWFTASGRAIACLGEGHFEEGAEWASKALAQNPRYTVAMRLLAANLANLGRMDGPAEAVADMLRIEPDLTMRKLRARLMFMHDALWQNLSRGLKLAGLPD
jgi:TolB-like protein/Flp pilus assembly protein TadD